MSPSEILSLISRTNKVSIIFFVITCILLGYELYLYLKDKKGMKRPSIPMFKKGPDKQPLTTRPAKPIPTPPPHPSQQHKPSPVPPLITRMSPPTMSHSPAGFKGPVIKGPVTKKPRKKMSRGAKAAIGGTAALAVLTIGIAWKLNQPTTQEASLPSKNTRATERVATDTGSLQPTGVSGDIATVSDRKIPIFSPPSPTPDSKAIDLTSNTKAPADNFSTVASSSASSSADMVPVASSTSSVLTKLPETGGNSSPTATLAPTLPIAGTIQYSLGLLVVASVIIIASLIF